MSDVEQVDVLVVGGGPAGSSVAQRLVSLGHDVLLVEASAGPRAHVDASLPLSILPLLDAVQARDRVLDAGFQAARHPTVAWPELRDNRAQGAFGGLHVERARFDDILLDIAAAAGTRVKRPAHAMEPARRLDGIWETVLRVGREMRTVASRVVVDATAGRLRSAYDRLGPPTLALHARWQHASDEDPCSILEAGLNEWMWCAPATNREMLVVVFVDPKRMSRKDRSAIERCFAELLLGTRLIGATLERAKSGPVHICDATARLSTMHAVPGLVRVGDASLKLDPLSSQGVQTAIASALQAAVVVNTMLRTPSLAATAAELYASRQDERAKLHRSKAARLYSEVAASFDTDFWQRRAAAPSVATIDAPPARAPMPLMEPLAVASDVIIETAPAFENDLVVMRRAVRLPNDMVSVVYVGTVEIAPLLVQTLFGRLAESIVADWKATMPAELGWSLIRWLWDRGVLVKVSDAGLLPTKPADATARQPRWLREG